MRLLGSLVLAVTLCPIACTELGDGPNDPSRQGNDLPSNPPNTNVQCDDVPAAENLAYVECSDTDPDPDSDGICCSLENYLQTDNTRPDIFIEIDYMPNIHSKRGMALTKKALHLVVQAFKKEGIDLHFDVGNYFSAQSVAPDPANFNLGGGNEVDYYDHIGLDTIPCSDSELNSITPNTPLLSSPSPNGNTNCHSDFVTIQELKENPTNFHPDRLGIFHYMILGDQPDYLYTLGLAEYPGNDFVITVGDLGDSELNPLTDTELDNQLAASIMHELGHNLYLSHGGSREQGSPYFSNKPNYESIMNYTYAFFGLAVRGSGVTWQAFNTASFSSGHCPGSPQSYLPFDYRNNEIVLDYSHGQNFDLDEYTFSERTGFDASGTPFDQNCNGSIDDTVGADVNQNGTVGDVLTDFDDWGNLYFHPTSMPRGFLNKPISQWIRCPIEQHTSSRTKAGRSEVVFSGGWLD